MCRACRMRNCAAANGSQLDMSWRTKPAMFVEAIERLASALETGVQLLRFPLFLLFFLAATTSATGSEDIQLYPGTPQSEPMQAFLTGESSGLHCLLFLEPSGKVRDAARCELNASVKRVALWKRDARRIAFYTASKRAVLSFQAIAPDIFRAADATPEPLRLRLLPASSMPMSQ
jgi:hypothetical protein